MERPSPYATAQRRVCKLRDVVSCEIEASSQGAIEAIHVTALAGRSPKQIARDIETLLAAEENLYVDYRKISIAQYGEHELPSPPTLERILFDGVSLHQGPRDCDVEVSLSAGHVNGIGRATGPNTRFHIRRLVAQATLDAVGNLVEGEPDLSLGDLEEKELGGRRVFLVCVNRTEGRNESRLIGCAEIGYDLTQSVINAVLDATNRIVSSLPPRQPVEYDIGPAPTE
ncbi:MAG TPA: hypothetical protein VKU85_12195 [bacterium]|nr:hypothetical protein [bacterium]